MRKLLFCGDINSQWSTLCDRVAKLQNSSHGPFDGLFCIGRFFLDEKECLDMCPTLSFPLPVFVLDRTGLSPDVPLPKSVYFLQHAGLETICGLSVCSLGNEQDKEAVAELMKTISDSNYKGCDLMISRQWPLHVMQFLPETEYETIKSLGVALSAGSELAAEVAYKAKPRLHFCGAMNVCYERAPYICSSTESSAQSTHDNTTFFYSLAGIPNGINPPLSGDEKSRRWMKAMSCEPMSMVGNRQRPLAQPIASTVTECPYAGVFSAELKKSMSGQKRPRDNIESSIKTTRPPLPPGPPPSASLPHASSSFFFGDTGVPRQGGKRGGNSLNLVPSSPDINVLFIGGLPPMPLDAVQDVLLPLFPTAKHVRGVADKPFAFVEFETHEEAARILAAHSSGQVEISMPASLGGSKLSIGWGKGKSEDSGKKKEKAPDRIAPSHFEDCWFCLASPVVKVHLVVSVSDHAYLSLPRGGMCDLHVLVVPIECAPNRLSITSESSNDLNRYLKAIDKMYKTQNCRLLYYERAIRTKGRDHMQLHCVPVPNDLLPRSIGSFMEICSLFNLRFHEVMDSSTIEDTVRQLVPGVPSPEYFYIEIPVGPSDNQTKRFIYIHEVGSYFKMHFGSEVAATIIGRPDRANWKNCLKLEGEESLLATNFRSAFESFDFTL